MRNLPLAVIARHILGVPETPLRFGERTNGDARSRRTNRIRLPSTADEDDAAIPQRGNAPILPNGLNDKRLAASGFDTRVKPSQ